MAGETTEEDEARAGLGRRAFIQYLSVGAAMMVGTGGRIAISAPRGKNELNDGLWSLRLDPKDEGVVERWFAGSFARALGISLPNSLPAQAIGDPITAETPWMMAALENREYYTTEAYARYRQRGQVKVPFFLQPPTYYLGAAWYRREFVIPPAWHGKRVLLSLERPHWETRVWVDDVALGRCDSLFTPHEYDLSAIPPGKHWLTIRVDNRLNIDIGADSHGVCDHTQGAWNGIGGDIRLSATAPVWIDDLQLYPDVDTRQVRVTGEVRSLANAKVPSRIILQCAGDTVPSKLEWKAGTASFEQILSFPQESALWDEFAPNLHEISAELPNGERRAERFGFRALTHRGTNFLMNGQPTFMRGTLECCIFPETGHPPFEKEAWRRLIRIARSFGLNMLRFHSWCPPEAAFEVGDEEGFYFQIETAWVTNALGDGKPVDDWIYRETDRILKAYGNHPSFLLMAYGNEPGGDRHEAWLRAYVAHFKARDPRRRWTTASGWPEAEENDYHVTPYPRIQLWGDELKSRVNAKPPETTTDYREFMAKRSVPVISHEIGQWCVYPDFDEMDQYTGYLKPKNFEIYLDRLKASGLTHLKHDFLMASGRLQTLLYKEEIESALRTPNMGGFQLLDLHDFPGQGTALVGVLNPFWREKGYVTAAEYRRFCGPTVVLARMAKRVFTNDEMFEAVLSVAHHGAQPLNGVTLYWYLATGSQRLCEHQSAVAGSTIPLGGIQDLLSVKCPLSVASKATKLRFVAGLKLADGQTIENDWDIWTYPASVSAPSSVKVVNQAEEALALVAKGERVLLTLPANKVRNFGADLTKIGFSTIFWNTMWTSRQAPTTMGILCDPAHPALADFPTDSHSNWHWWYILHRAATLRLDLLPEATQPIVRVIDDWFTARSLGLICEFRCLEGKLIITGVDLTDPEINDPVTRQLRLSLVRYLASPACQPNTEISAATLRALEV